MTFYLLVKWIILYTVLKAAFPYLLGILAGALLLWCVYRRSKNKVK